MEQDKSKIDQELAMLLLKEERLSKETNSLLSKAKIEKNYKFYTDLIDSIERKLATPKIKENSKNQLQEVLKKLKHEDNLVKIDFHKKLITSEKVTVLNEKLNDLEIKEQSLNQKTNDLLQKAELALSQ